MKPLLIPEIGLRLLLLITVFVSFFLNIHSVPLFDLDEGAFSEATREMLVRGDYISTYLNGVPRYDKPILIYWLQAASVSVLGINELAFRLPSALFSTLWVYLIYYFVKRVKDSETALLAAFIMASSLQVSIIARAAIADATLNFFITGSMFSIYLFYLNGEKKYIYLSFAAIALGFLTKGPIAVLIPLVVSFIFFLMKGRLTLWLRTIFNPYGILIFVLLAAPWYIAQYLKEGQAFIDGFFLKHNLERFNSPLQHHSGSMLYYLPVLLIGILPYTSAFLRVLTRIKDVIKDDLQVYLGIWIIFVIVFFSFAQTKLHHYIVYGYPAVFILMSFYISTLRSRLLALLPQAILFASLLLVPMFIASQASTSTDPFLRTILLSAGDYFSFSYQLFFGFALVLTLYFMLEKKIALAHKLLLSGTVTVLGLSIFIVPLAGQLLQQPIKDAALIAKQANYKVIMWDLNTPSFNVYTRRLVEKREPRAGDIVITKSKNLQRLKSFDTLYLKNGIALVKVTQ